MLRHIERYAYYRYEQCGQADRRRDPFAD